MSPNNQEAQPLFRRVRDDLRRQITSGSFAAGARIPSISELCSSHQVSAITVRRALSDLVTEGLLRGAQGRGMFVAEQRPRKAVSSGLIGLIIPESSEASRFMAGIRRGIEAGVGSAVPLLIGISEMNARREADLLSDMARHQVAGVLVVAATGARDMSSDARIRALIDDGLRVVYVDRRPVGMDVDWVTSDNEQTGRRAGELLLSQGHRRIAFIWAHECVTFSARRAGLEAALRAQQCSLDPLLARGGWESNGDYEGCGYLKTLELFHLDEPPTAIFAGNDPIAVGAMRALRFLGKRIPVDVSLIGVDALAMTEPPLTSMRQDMEGMGLWAVEQLRRRIAGDMGPARVHLLPTTLVERSSVAQMTTRPR